MFATSADVAVRLGAASLSAEDDSMAAQLIEAATGYIAEAADQNDEWVTSLSPVPKVLKALCVELVVRAMANPSAAQSVSETLGSYSYSQSFMGVGVALTEDEVRMVRRVVNANSGRASGAPESVIEQALIDLGAVSASLDRTSLGPGDPAFYIGS